MIFRMRYQSLFTLLRFAICLFASVISISAYAQVPLGKLQSQLSPVEMEIDIIFKQSQAPLKEDDIAGLETAYKKLAQALEKAKIAKLEHWVAKLQSQMANYAIFLSRFQEAERLSIESKEGYSHLKDIAGEANCLLILSNIRQYSAKYDEMLKFAQQARSLTQQTAETDTYLKSIYRETWAYVFLGQFDKALKTINIALDLATKIKNNKYIAMSKYGIGSIYAFLGQYSKARGYFHNAGISFQFIIHSNNDAANAFLSEGLMLINLRRYSEGEQLSKLVLNFAEQDKDENLIAFGKMALGLMNWYQHKYSSSLASFGDALSLYDKFYKSNHDETSRLYAAYCHAGMAMASVGLGQGKEALSHCSKVDSIVDNFSELRDLMVASGIRGEAYSSLHQWSEAQKSHEKCLSYLDMLTQQLTEAAAVSQLLDILPHPYARAALPLIRLNKGIEALAVIERGRGRGLAKQAALNQVDFSRLLTQTERNQLKYALASASDARQKVRSLSAGTNLVNAPDSTQRSSNLELAKTQYNETEKRLSILRESLYKVHEDYGRLQGAKPPKPNELLTLAKKNPDTLYLEYSLMNENSTLLFALSASGGLKSFEIPVGEEELQDQVQAWRFAMNAGAQARGDSDEKKSAGDKSLQVKAREIDEETRYSRLLYDELIDPVEKAGLFGINYQSHGARNLKKRKSLIKRLVIVSDGCLLSLPFAALKDKEGRRLIQKHPISSAISLGSLLWPAKKKKSVEILLSAADPMRTKAETFRTARGRVPMPSAVAMNSSSEFNSTWRGSYLPLRYAYEEGRAIALLFDGALFVSGPLAQKRTLLENLPKYRILHFATHGYLNATDGLQSGLIFAPDVDQSEGGRILVAGEIVNLPLSAEMSVLSGCHTAEGQLSGGEGMLGLAWAFRAAGCPAVVASQWAVDDRATRILMVAFYRQLKLGVPKDIALQRAIASVALEFPEPYFWASFQILGDRNQLFPSQSAGSAIRR